jgi:hypothetical protein
VEVEASLQETIRCGENGFTVENTLLVMSASNKRSQKRLVACDLLPHSDVGDRFIIDQPWFSRQDAVAYILVQHHMSNVISDHAGALELSSKKGV